MPNKILIMGLPGSGKTTIARKIVKKLLTKYSVLWLNADEVRKENNDWDFSVKGRKRQSTRMKKLANSANTDYVVCDFIAPTKELRLNFDADYVIWMDTIEEGRFEDTNTMFTSPDEYNFRIKQHINDVDVIVNSITGHRNDVGVLHNIQIPEFANMQMLYSGMDSLDRCQDKYKFINYPNKISYDYNSRGFRDTEWPSDGNNAIWCLGDSFTVGLGQPLEETWPQLLQSKTNTRTVNVSMVGASNDWLKRQANYILNEINPIALIIQWSFIHRREKPDTNLSDCERRTYHGGTHIEGEIDESLRLKHMPTDVLNLLSCMSEIESNKNNINVVHSIIPFLPYFDYNIFIKAIHKKCTGIQFVEYNKKIDFARDGYHYGHNTAQNYVDNYINAINSF